MLAIGPLTEYFVSRSWHTRLSFPDAWLKYVRTGDVLSGSGPLWFCLALLMFSIGYAAVRQFPLSLAPTHTLGAVPRLGAIAGFVAGLGSSTFAIRVLTPSGATFFNMQLADFPQYILMFVLGAYAWRLRWLARLDAEFGKRIAIGALLAGFLLWAGLLVFGGALAGDTSAYSGGLTWQNLGMSLWAAIIARPCCRMRRGR